MTALSSRDPRYSLTPEEREDAVARTREMIRVKRRGRRDRWPPVVLGSTYIVVAMSALTWLDGVTSQEWIAAVLLLGVYVAGQRAALEDAEGSFVPTQATLVVMLFLVPLPLIPILVMVGDIFGSPRDPAPYHAIFRLFYKTANCWYIIGPVLVLAIADSGPADLGDWPVYLGAFAAQLAGELMVTVVYALYMKQSLARMLKGSGYVAGVDIVFAAFTITALIATAGSLWSVLFAAGPIVLLFFLTHEQREQAARAEAATDALDDAVEQSRLDPLTTLPNRRKWIDAIEQAEQRRACENGVVVTAVMADIDGLKCTNDNLGHQVGDEIIRAAAAMIQRAAPADAVVARLGGDEFGMLVVRGAGGEVDGQRIIDEIRAGIDARGLVGGVQLSMSFGTATCPPAATVDGAVAEADRRGMADKRARGLARE